MFEPKNIAKFFVAVGCIFFTAALTLLMLAHIHHSFFYLRVYFLCCIGAFISEILYFIFDWIDYVFYSDKDDIDHLIDD